MSFPTSQIKDKSSNQPSYNQYSSSDLKQRGFTGLQSKRRPIFTEHIGSSSRGIDPNEGEDPGTLQVLWGTNINVNEIQYKFRDFISSFNPIGYISQSSPPKAFYLEEIVQMKETEIFTLNLNCDHIYQFDPHLYNQLVNYPSEVIPYFDLVCFHIYKELFMQGEDDLAPQIQTRTYNLRETVRMRDLNPGDIDKLMSIRGIVIRTSDINPIMKEAYFKCAICQKTEILSIDRTTIKEPGECSNCHTKNGFELIHNLCTYSDMQYIKLQETPENVPEGETPQTILLCCYDDLVDFIKPGDRVEITGIYRVHGVRVNQNKRILKNVYRTYCDIVSFQVATKKVYISESSSFKEVKDNEPSNIGNEQKIEFSQQLESKFYEISKDPQLYKKLVDAVAPSIWENTDIKKGILMQLFGGVSKNFEEFGRGRFRGEVNILLVGDPSTAKSQFLQYVHKLANRGIYTSGKGSSAVGLTAYVTKDPETRDIILESGALVLSDKGICCIDEFDKMDEGTRSVLHEAMEQQTISIAKAGIICQLNARTAILAAANPVDSKYNPKLSVVQNIKLPPSLLSRFDLIYLVLDKQGEDADTRLASHIVTLYGESEEVKLATQSIISHDLLAKYITYARKYFNPIIDDRLVDILINNYVEMRQVGNVRNTITATPRQLESLIRLSEAHARMRLSKVVEEVDVNEALRLIKVATQMAATDPTTGLIDMDLITTGVGQATRANVDKLKEKIYKILKEDEELVKKSIKSNNLYQKLSMDMEITLNGKEKITETEYEAALKGLEEENKIIRTGNRKNYAIKLLLS